MPYRPSLLLSSSLSRKFATSAMAAQGGSAKTIDGTALAKYVPGLVFAPLPIVASSLIACQVYPRSSCCSYQVPSVNLPSLPASTCYHPSWPETRLCRLCSHESQGCRGGRHQIQACDTPRRGPGRSSRRDRQETQ